MTNEPPDIEQTARRDTPRETVSGDRVCMQCLHPLAGSTIVREPETGLLYCRCVECGTAAAMLEYPTITPWIRRMKSVATVTVGVGGLFPGIAAEAASESADALVEAYRASGGSTRDSSQQYDSGRYGVADQAWLDSEAGRAALRASRTSPDALLPFLGFAVLGSTLLIPVMLLLGLVCMRRHPLVRALAGLLIPTIGGAISIAGFLVAARAVTARPQNITWTNFCVAESGPVFSMLMVAWLAVVGAVTAMAAPPLAAAMFRFILPPRDRRLVAWIWEWRGKPIPKD